MVPSKANVVPVLFNVPIRFTVPPARLNVSKPASVNSPARFTVESVASMVPVLLQAFVE